MSVVLTKAFWWSAIEWAVVVGVCGFLGSISATAGTITTSNLYAAAWSSLVGVLYSVQKSINQASAVDALDELNKL